ncbi:hypothetical protein NCS56_01021600 [Fusarium sp. Ph1]|nr:hypothetical protein NCS56_01021600 [Fusarium sp. Ph1]
MATLDSLKKALREKGTATSSTTPRLSDSQYLHGFSILARGSTAYQDFIVPQLAQLAPLVNSDSPISVLEIGPGPKSILGYLPEHLRKKIGKYSALEPNQLFVSQLQDWLNESLPCLGSPPDIRLFRFDLSRIMHHLGEFDFIVFCHSMYGMTPKRSYIRHALEMLVDGGLVVVFHRENPKFDGLVCQQTVSFPTGVTRMPNDSTSLDFFAPFIAGFQAPALRLEWRKVCRDLGRREEANLVFASPEIMETFNKHATAVLELMLLVPSLKEKTVKNREAYLH